MPPLFRIGFTVDAKSLTHMYRELPGAVHRRQMRRALTAAAVPIVRALRNDIKNHQTKDTTGTLSKSIGSVVRTHRTRLTSNIRIGVLRKPGVNATYKNRKYARWMKRRNKPTVFRKASRYFHLADKRRDGQERVERIFNRHKAAAEVILLDKLEEGLMNEAARLGKQI